MVGFALSTVDPSAELDDLEPLLDVVAGARVVAVGEANHCVREFGLLRHRVIRLLVERAGFDVVAWESGFPESWRVAEWVAGGAGDLDRVAREGLCYRFGEVPEVRDVLGWLRGRGVGFAGVDLPGSGGSAGAVWPLVAEFAERVGSGLPELVARARSAVAEYAAVNSGLALQRYAGLDESRRGAASEAVAELSAWLAGFRPPVSLRERHAWVAHAVRGLVAADRSLRELVASEPVLAARDAYMAESVRWLLGRHRRVVVAVHNGHAQRVPLEFAGVAELRPMGAVLAEELGPEYRAVGVTAAGGGVTPGVELDASAPQGIRLCSSPLPPVREGSVEAWAGPGLVGVDLRGWDGAVGPQWIRHSDQYVATPVCAAFDGLLQVPGAVPSAPVPVG